MTPPEFNSEFSPEKWMVGSRLLSFWHGNYFQGRAVKLPGSMTFHCTDWIIGILILAYYIPIYSLYNWVEFHPLYNQTNEGFGHC